MLFSLARTNFGTSRCELRGLSQLWCSILFFYWVADKARVRLPGKGFFQDGNRLISRAGLPHQVLKHIIVSPGLDRLGKIVCQIIDNNEFR